MTKRVAVLMGGRSSERPVSLVSGKACVEGLRAAGYIVKTVDAALPVPDLVAALSTGVDVVFNALHGPYGEDGRIQGLLDLMGLPYTHSGMQASALAMDKSIARQIFIDHGLRCAEGRVVRHSDLIARDPMPRPYVGKPIDEGSTFGVQIVRPGDNDLGALAPGRWRYGEWVLVETYIPGQELTVAVMGDRSSGATALGVTEIRPKSAFYDYEAKYSPGGSVHLCPAPLPDAVAAEAMRMATEAHLALGCSGVSRADLRYDDTSGGGPDQLYLLEVNTQPGMTPTSLVPEQALVRGISFPDLVSWIVEHPVVPQRPGAFEAARAPEPAEASP